MTDRSKTPTQRGHTGPVDAQSTLDEAATEIFDTDKPPRRTGRSGGGIASAPAMAEPIQVTSMKTPHESGPVAISMKTPMHTDVAADGPTRTPVVKRPKLRAISEITPLPHAQPKNLGYLAPPRDPAEVRSRRVRDLVMWSSVSVIVASVVALVIWFVAR